MNTSQESTFRPNDSDASAGKAPFAKLINIIRADTSIPKLSDSQCLFASPDLYTL